MLRPALASAFARNQPTGKLVAIGVPVLQWSSFNGPLPPSLHRVVDLGTGAQVTALQIYSRHDCCADRLSDLEIRLGNTDPTTTPAGTLITVNDVVGQYPGPPS